MTYEDFLKTKIELATDSGFEVDRESLNPALMQHQKDAVAWALRGGKRALFESFGLGKTVQEYEFCYQTVWRFIYEGHDTSCLRVAKMCAAVGASMDYVMGLKNEK